ncbi:MAG: cysteine methyltransferase [Chloroflexi bacterium 44-23]|nr:MAG: cysteine methyltransferase [Chloroflexi bacterium 44-23]
MDHKPTYRDRVFDIVCCIPFGKVATYGQIARMVPGCTARMVGYALASLPDDSDVPWQRVINAQGKISPRGTGYGALIQRQLLDEEGVIFDQQEKINFEVFGWFPQ